jgi:hypothetical protein
MADIGTCAVNVITPAGIEAASLTLASKEDMPKNWAFSWPQLWLNTDADYQRIIKMTLQGHLIGLVRYSLFSVQGDETIDTLEVEQLEISPAFQAANASRLAKPVGKWCFWYAARVALTLCADKGRNQRLIVLSALPEAFNYYQDVIRMEYLGSAPSAPGEDLYAFALSRRSTEEYCQRLVYSEEQ